MINEPQEPKHNFHRVRLLLVCTIKWDDLFVENDSQEEKIEWVEMGIAVNLVLKSEREAFLVICLSLLHDAFIYLIPRFWDSQCFRFGFGKFILGESFLIHFI